MVAQQDRSRRRVLVVEDNADLAELLGAVIREDSTLEFVGYVTTGAEAIERGRFGAADVMVLDVSLRDISGLRVLERLRAEAPALKVILHTGYASEELAEFAKGKGAAAYVVKDGNPSSLLDVIRGI